MLHYPLESEDESFDIDRIVNIECFC